MRHDLETFHRNYAAALSKHGVTPKGVLWPDPDDLAMRFEVLMSLLQLQDYNAEKPMRLLDLGCGPGFLLDYLASNGRLNAVSYTGVDVLESTIGPARIRWPGYQFEIRDVRDHPFEPDQFDCCIICGVFTGRFENSYEQTVAMAQDTLRALWSSVKSAIAFNVMSKHVDWEREDLFHWPLDALVGFCKQDLSRHVALRLDYGLWETSAVVRKAPAVPESLTPDTWLPEQPELP
jgi:SAM-dependent methyltransferase